MAATVHVHFEEKPEVHFREVLSGSFAVSCRNAKSDLIEVHLYFKSVEDADRLADAIYHHKMDEAADDMQVSEAQTKAAIEQGWS